jgi:hypothetical protein
MAIRFTPGQGFQSIPDKTPIVTIPGIKTPSGGSTGGTSGSGRSGRSGGSSGVTVKKDPVVVIKDIVGGTGTEVIIDGVGYSVMPGQTETFLKSKGLSGLSYNQALTDAKAKDTVFKQSVISQDKSGIRYLSNKFPTLDLGGKNIKTLNTTSKENIIKFKQDKELSLIRAQKENERVYNKIFGNEESRVTVLDYDSEGNPISFKYKGSVYDGKYAIENLNSKLNSVTQTEFIKEQEAKTIKDKGINQYSKDKAFQLGTEALEELRQKTFSGIDILSRFRMPTKEEINAFSKDMGIETKELSKFENKNLKTEKDKFWDNLNKDARNIKDKTKSEFIKGAVDDVYDLLNIASLGVYASASDSKTRKEIGMIVATSLLTAPKTYWDYLKKDPLGGSAFTIGSIVGIGGLVGGIVEGGKALNKANISTKIKEAVTEVENVKKINLDKLRTAGIDINKLNKDYGIDFTKVINGLEDASSVGLNIKLDKLSPKYIKAWEMFEGVGESTGKLSPRVLKQFSDKELRKMDVKVSAKAETELTGGVLQKMGQVINDLTDSKISFQKRKGITFEANQVPTGRIIGQKTGKNYIDNFAINPDKSFSGTAKRIMNNGDVVEQKYYTKGVGAIVREFYVNGKLKYTVTQARTGGRIVVKSGSDLAFEGLKPRIAKNMEIVEETFKEIRKKATISDIKQNFFGRVKAFTKDLTYVKATPLKQMKGIGVFLKDGNKFLRVDVLTPARIVKSQTDVFADFLKKRKTNLLADNYIAEVTNLRSMILPEYKAFRRTLYSSELSGIFKRNPTLFEKTKSFIKRLNDSTTEILNRSMNKRGSTSLTISSGKRYFEDYKYANEVKVKYSIPLQTNLEKSISDMSRVLGTFQNTNISFGFRKLWVNRLVRLKLQSEYLKYINKQHILTSQEYARLSRLDSKTDTKTNQKMAQTSKLRSEVALKFDRKMESSKLNKFPDMAKFKLELLKFPRFGKDSKRRFVDKVLGTKKAKSYVVLLGSGKKQRVASKRLKPEEAISYGAYLTDRKGDRTVRIVPAKGKPNAKFKLDYLSQASKKFRNYRIKNKRKIRYSSARLIERRKFFNDMPGEIRRKKRKVKK